MTIAIITVAALVTTAAVILQVRRARQHETARARLVRLRHEQAEHARTTDLAVLGPSGDPLTRDVTAVLTAYVLDHPELADGFTRLDRAIREDQHEGEL